MKKHLKKVITVTIVALAVFCQHSCNKESGTPEQSCKTCIARDKLEGAPVNNKQVCGDEAEQEFRNENADFNVTCE